MTNGRKLSWAAANSLWLVALALMAASAGLDGAYMARMMPAGAGWAGYILNGASDAAGLVLMFWFARLRQSPKNTKRYRLALALLPAEIVTTVYAWFFSWRQLLLILPAVEGDAAGWVALVAAGFIPLLLAFVGFAQALLAGRLEGDSIAKAPSDSEVAQKAPSSTAKAQAASEVFECEQCNRSFGSKQALGAHMRFCKGKK